MERLAYMGAAALCLAGGFALFSLLPQKPSAPKPEPEFRARVYRTEPALKKEPVARERTKPNPKKAKEATRKPQKKAKPIQRPAPESTGQAWQPVETTEVATAGVEVEVIGSDWESSVQYYSGGSYGVAHINKHAKKEGNGGYPNDREIIARSAAKYGIPFALLWGTYGAESSWGQNTGGGELPPYFGLTSAYPGGGQSRYRGTSGNFVSDAEKAARSWLKIYRLKNSGRNPA